MNKLGSSSKFFPRSSRVFERKKFSNKTNKNYSGLVKGAPLGFKKKKSQGALPNDKVQIFRRRLTENDSRVSNSNQNLEKDDRLSITYESEESHLNLMIGNVSPKIESKMHEFKQFLNQTLNQNRERFKDFSTI